MSKYVEKNLYENEWIVMQAKRSVWGLVGRWIFGILCCWMLLIPTILAIVATVKYNCTELTLTNKRLVRKEGVFRTESVDVPLNKIINVSVKTTFWGKVFNTNRIYIHTEVGRIVDKLHGAIDFKNTILGQIDSFDEYRMAQQANWTAQAMARVGVAVKK